MVMTTIDEGGRGDGLGWQPVRTSAAAIALAARETRRNLRQRHRGTENSKSSLCLGDSVANFVCASENELQRELHLASRERLRRLAEVRVGEVRALTRRRPVQIRRIE